MRGCQGYAVRGGIYEGMSGLYCKGWDKRGAMSRNMFFLHRKI